MSGVHLTMYGLPDRRYRENGGGQANRRYPPSYDYNGYGGAYSDYGPSFNDYGRYMPMGQPRYGQYGGNYAAPITRDGYPDMRFAQNRY